AQTTHYLSADMPPMIFTAVDPHPREHRSAGRVYRPAPRGLSRRAGGPDPAAGEPGRLSGHHLRRQGHQARGQAAQAVVGRHRRPAGRTRLGRHGHAQRLGRGHARPSRRRCQRGPLRGRSGARSAATRPGEDALARRQFVLRPDPAGPLRQAGGCLLGPLSSQGPVLRRPGPPGVRGAGLPGAGRYVEDWGWLGSPKRPKKRMYVRRITLYRPGEKDVILVTNLCDAAAVPAVDLLEVYLNRWGIERMFQQVTEVFGLEHLIGTTPEGVIFQFAMCLLLYNLIQVVRGEVAAGVRRGREEISGEKLFEDVQLQMIAWSQTVEPEETMAHFEGEWTAPRVKVR